MPASPPPNDLPAPGDESPARRIRPHIARMVERTDAVLLPFQSMVSVQTPVDLAGTAEAMRLRLETRGHRLPLLLAVMQDPEALLAHAHGLSREDGAHADQILDDAETTALKDAVPAPDTAELINACRATGRQIAIVTSRPTYAAYAADRFTIPVIGAKPGRRRSARLEPNEQILTRATRALRCAPLHTTLIALTPEMAFSAVRAGLQSLGIVSKHAPRKHLANMSETDSAAVASMSRLAEIFAALPPHTDHQSDN